MTARYATELLYDSEAALRLVDSAIEDIRETDPRAGTGAAAEPIHAGHLRDLLQTAGPLGLLGISQILARGYGEIASVLQCLRESRDVLARTTADKLQHAHESGQFQDITNHQLSYASSVLAETEARLAELASMLGPSALGAAGAGTSAAAAENAEACQAVVDQIADPPSR